MKSIAHEAVFNQIMDSLEKGVIPWRKPWKNSTPRNGLTNRKYSGINFFILSASGYADERWLTYRQVKELGGEVKKGEKSKQIVFWNILSKEQDGKKKNIPLLKYFNVFNIEQTEGIKVDTIELEPNLTAESIVEGYTDKPVIKYFGNKACYIPSKDEVNMPPVNFFDSVDEFYSTLFHELSHSVLHETRMNRKIDTVFGSRLYTEQELEAEFSSAFLCNESGIDNTLENSAAYIQSWMKSFKDNPDIIITAASKAQKTADYILKQQTV